MTTDEIMEQARADMAQLDIGQLRCGVLLQLMHIERLKAERDATALAAAGEIMEAAIVSRGEIDRLTKERDECRRQSDLQMNCAIKFCQERNAARIERDALAAAAKLAVAALEKVHYEAINSGVNNYSRLLGDIAKAHDALKAGVQ